MKYAAEVRAYVVPPPRPVLYCTIQYCIYINCIPTVLVAIAREIRVSTYLDVLGCGTPTNKWVAQYPFWMSEVVARLQINGSHSIVGGLNRYPRQRAVVVPCLTNSPRSSRSASREARSRQGGKKRELLERRRGDDNSLAKDH